MEQPPVAGPAIDLGVPRDLGALFDATFSLWGKNLAAFLSLAFVIVAPVSVAVQAITRAIQPDVDQIRAQFDAAPKGQLPDLTIPPGLVVGVIAIALLSVVQAPLVTATHARALVHLSRYPTIGFLPALRVGIRVVPAALLAELLAGLLTAFALLALVIPGVYVGVRLNFAAQAAAVDRAGVRAAVATSWRTVGGHWWRTFGILLLFGLMAVIASGVFTGVANAIARGAGLGSLSLAINIIGAAVTASVSALAATLLFFDLRARHATPPPEEAEAAAW